MGREDHLRKGSDVTPYEALVAGSVSGAVSRAITAPLDTVKIRLQLQETRLGQYEGATRTVALILRHEGVRALWKGNVPAEIMYIFYGAVQFTTYLVLSRELARLEERLRWRTSAATHSFVVGAGSGLASTFATYPFDLLRTRLAAHKERRFLSMRAVVASIWAREGPRGFFAGFPPAAASVASTTAIMFWAYEQAREWLAALTHVPFIEGICGFAAGTVLKGVTFPLDTLRKRMQMHSVTHGAHAASTWRLCIAIAAQEGVFGFYKGYGISVLKTAPTSALSLYMYELVLRYIR